MIVIMLFYVYEFEYVNILTVIRIEIHTFTEYNVSLFFPQQRPTVLYYFVKFQITRYS